MQTDPKMGMSGKAKTQLLNELVYMSRTLFIILLIGWSLAAGALGWSLCRLTDKEVNSYREIAQNQSLAKAEKTLASDQQRVKVCKEIWYPGAPARYLRIESHDSQLELVHQQGTLEVVEKLQGVSGFMREEAETPDATTPPTVWFLEAKTAQYYYHTQRLVAQEVTLWRYYQETTETAPHRAAYAQQAPLFIGETPTLELSLQDNPWSLHSSQLHATFPTKEVAR